MEEFPSKDELQVVAALLLLSHPPPSTTPPPPPPPPSSSSSCDKHKHNKHFQLWNKEFIIHNKYKNKKKKKKKKKNLGAHEEEDDDISKTTTMRSIQTPSSTSNSSLTTANTLIPTPHCRILTSASSSHPLTLMHLKVARRARSKVIYLSPDHKPAASVNQKAETSSQITTEEGSCLSTGRTHTRTREEVSSGRKTRSSVVEQTNRRRVGVGPPHIRRSADAIMRLLSRGGCASEVRIRQLLGDSPDTSKALRMLLRMDKVKRRGAGGRADPYIYMVAATAVDHNTYL